MVSKYRNMGQTCVCANRLYAQDKIYDQFVEKLSKKVAAMKIGDGTEEGVVQGPLINMEAVDKVEKHIADAVKGGAKIVTGGKRHALGGTFFEPTVLSDVRSDALVSQGQMRLDERRVSQERKERSCVREGKEAELYRGGIGRRAFEIGEPALQQGTGRREDEEGKADGCGQSPEDAQNRMCRAEGRSAQSVCDPKGTGCEGQQP